MPIPNSIVITISDADGDVAKTAFYVADASLAAYNEISPDLADLVDNIIYGKVEGAQLRALADVSALIANTAEDTSDVGDVGQFQFRTVDNRPVRVNVPGLDETKVAVNSDDINQADANVAAFITAMVAGIAVTGGTIQPCNVGEDSILSVEFARERFRNRGARS